jgi:hypothetical protein
MNKYKMHKDKNINSLIQIMALRGEELKKLDEIDDENNILRANLLEKDEFLSGLVRN